MLPLEVVRLTELMAHTTGRPEVRIGLIDGPVVAGHASLAGGPIRQVSTNTGVTCHRLGSMACRHGTFVAGILSGKRNSLPPAICPGCTLLVHPIFAEAVSGQDRMPSATPLELAAAVIACIDAGARIINLSLGLMQTSATGSRVLEEALSYAARSGVILVAAAGNQGTVGSSIITRHPWVIPVVACDRMGRPLEESNLGSSIGRWGLRAPGDNITSLSAEGGSLTLSGTSVAAPFVTGTIALLWSAFPAATAAQIRFATVKNGSPQRASIVPPLLNAAVAYQTLLKASGGGNLNDKGT